MYFTFMNPKFKAVCWIMVFSLVLPPNLPADDSQTLITAEKGGSLGTMTKAVPPPANSKTLPPPASTTKTIPPAQSTEPAGGALAPATFSTNETFINVPAPTKPGTPAGTNMVLAGVNTTPNSFPSQTPAPGNQVVAAPTAPGTPAGSNLVPAGVNLTPGAESNPTPGGSGLTITQSPFFIGPNALTGVNSAPGYNLTEAANTNPDLLNVSFQSPAEGYHYENGQLIANTIPIQNIVPPPAEEVPGFHAVSTTMPNGSAGFTLEPDPAATGGSTIAGTVTVTNNTNQGTIVNGTQTPGLNSEPGTPIEPALPEPPRQEIIVRTIPVFVDGTLLTDDSFDNRDIPVRYRISGSRVITDTWLVYPDGRRDLLNTTAGSQADFNPAADCLTAPCSLTIFQSVNSQNEMVGQIHSMTITGYTSTTNPDNAVRFQVLGGSPIPYMGTTTMGIDNQNRLFYEQPFTGSLSSFAAVQGTKRTFVGVYLDRSPAVDTTTLLLYKREFYIGLEGTSYPRQVAQTDEGPKFFPRSWISGDRAAEGKTVVYGNSPTQSRRIENGEINRTGRENFFTFDREITVNFTKTAANFVFDFRDIESTANITVPVSPRYKEPARTADFLIGMLVFPERNGVGFSVSILPAIELTDIPGSQGVIETDKARVALATYFNYPKKPKRGKR